MKYFLIPLFTMFLVDSSEVKKVHITETGLNESQIEFLIEHEAYDDFIDAFNIDTSRVDFN